MKSIFTFLFIVSCVFYINAQNINSITGIVVNEKDEETIGNIIVMSTVDSSFIKGESFFEDSFEIKGLKHAEVLLKFTSLDFQDTYRTIRFEGNSVINLGKIVIANSGVDLDEVIVKAKKPVYIQKSDGTISVLIENTTLSASNSVSEILSKSPEVVLDESGEVGVFGKGTAILYLNGKRITNEQLSLIVPSNIKSIDIIRNPSAKYDAEGAAVIQIVTIQQNVDGYKVNLMQNTFYSPFGGLDARSNVSLNLKKGKLSSNMFASFRFGADRERLFTTRDRDADNVFLTTKLTTNWREKFKNYSNYGLGLQFDLNEHQYLSLAYSGAYEDLGGETHSTNEIVTSEGPSFYESRIEIDQLGVDNSISLNYSNTLDTLGSSFFLGGEFANFMNTSNNPIVEESTEYNIISARNLKNLFNLDVFIYSGQLDYAKIFQNKNLLEIGAKQSYVNNISSLDFLTAEDGVNFTRDENLSNDFSYDEAISAVYINFKGKLTQQLTYNIGLRSEYTDYKLQYSLNENQDIKDKYINFFPNFSISRSFAEGRNVNFSYASRIRRVSYQNLNPVLYYQDPYTSIQGNPDLKPETTHAFEINSKFNNVNFKMGYNYVIDPFGATAKRGDDEKSYILQGINYKDSHVFFASPSRTFNTDWLTSTNTVSVKYTILSDDQFDFEKIDSKPQFYFYTNNRFDIFKSLKGEVLFWYNGNNYEGLHLRRSSYNITLTLEKSFFDKALKCRLIANDIFHNRIAQGNYGVGQTDVYYNRRWSTEYFLVSLNYNFGKLKKGSFKNRGVGASENGRVD